MRSTVSPIRYATLFFVFALAPCRYASADSDPVKNFAPGNYTLVEGEEKLCGAGKFYVTADGSRIWLGPFYQFKTKNAVDTARSDYVIEKGCQETTEYKIESKGKSTHVIATDTTTCKGDKKQVIINEATITKSKVSFTQTHELLPKDNEKIGGSPHSCVWKPSKK